MFLASLSFSNVSLVCLFFLVLVHRSKKMHNTETPNTIKLIITIFFKSKLWNIENDTTLPRTWQKILHLIYVLFVLSFVVSLAVGALTTKDNNERILSAVCSIAVAIHTVRLVYIIWGESEILNLLDQDQLSAHSTSDNDQIIRVSDQLNNFVEFVKCFLLMCSCGIFLLSIIPILSSEKLLIFKIALPLDPSLDLKNSEIAFRITNGFIVLVCIFNMICYLLAIIIWYLALNCAIKYDILGNELMKLGVIKTKDPTLQKLHISKTAQEQLFLQDLISAIKSYKKINE